MRDFSLCAGYGRWPTMLDGWQKDNKGDRTVVIVSNNSCYNYLRHCGVGSSQWISRTVITALWNKGEREMETKRLQTGQWQNEPVPETKIIFKQRYSEPVRLMFSTHFSMTSNVLNVSQKSHSGILISHQIYIEQIRNLQHAIREYCNLLKVFPNFYK